MPPMFSKFFARYGLYVGIVVLTVLILTLVYCTGRNAGKSDEVIDQQERELDFKAAEGDANANAAETRVDDAVRIAAEEKELQDALKAETDPAARRVLRGCIILRQQGRDTSGIPECG